MHLIVSLEEDDVYNEVNTLVNKIIGRSNPKPVNNKG